MKTKVTVLSLVASCIVAALSLALAGVMYGRVRAFDARHKCDVLAGLSPTELMARESQKKVEAKKSIAERILAGDDAEEVSRKPDKPTRLYVERAEYDGEREISIVLSARPDMDVVRNYVKVEPLIDGKAGFSYSTPYDYQRGDYLPVLRITGNYAYRTNITVKILKGFPLYGKGANPKAEGSLTNDFVQVFRRNDPKPSVSYADKGRYLPPGGRGALRVEAVSVTNIYTEIYRVEPRNVVQLLSRESNVYRRGSWYRAKADEEDTTELSGACETGCLHCVNRPCEKEVCLFPVAMKDGGPKKGIFLTVVRNGDCERDERHWYNNADYNPNLYRLVCLSDLGLSVREDGHGGLGVWVTSLTTGRPVKAARVEVYSSANILLAEGTSDASGWCEVRPKMQGKPFAVIVRTPSDMTFMALTGASQVDETDEEGARPGYLKENDLDAFVWTERGIYRHDEKIFVHALVHNGRQKAPKPLPIQLVLRNPEGDVWDLKTLVTDDEGSLTCDQFTVPAEQPSGKWKIEVRLPSAKGDVEDHALLAEREIKIEEFAPPQIRVNVCADEQQHPSNFTFSVTAEHLFGGPARALVSEGAVVFEDVPFAPKSWKGYTFGNEERGLKPCFRRLSSCILDDKGRCEYAAPLWADSGRPKAAVRATGQGIVFEDGGRPATARKSIICHYYPYYIGSNLPSWIRKPETTAAKIEIVCVDTHGALLATPRKLVGKIERIDSIYSYQEDDEGRNTWSCDRVRSVVLDEIPITIGETGRVEYELPLKDCGDYVLTVEDPETGSSFGRTFYLSDWGDETIRAPLSNPTEVTMRTDKSFYRVGERPRLMVKSPFAGYAVLSVMREGRIYDEIVNLTNATSEIVLRAVAHDWAPNADVAISVVQSVGANAKHLAARAHGRTTIRVRPVEEEIDVRLDAEVQLAGGVKGGSHVTARVEAPGASFAVVTLVDEGINLLTDERVPDPVGRFSRPRDGALALHDLYNKILPVAEGELRASGVKTGGGFGAEMLGRVSPVPTRRFKPLALWKAKVALREGRGSVDFDLPEFVGEVRITAVAYSSGATGATSIQKKVAPKLIMQPDAPRFAAPGDAFDVTLTLRNTSAKAGVIRYDISEGKQKGTFNLAAGDSTNVISRVLAPKEPGEIRIVYQSEGLGETHRSVILVPIRPAVAWREESGVERIEPEKEILLATKGDTGKFALALSGTPVAELVSALTWLSEYPHGCLEQTTSRIFPLVAAGGILGATSPVAATNRSAYVQAGVKRVESMIHENDFVMWPDSNYAPWDREVSLYAAHFLIAAEKSGERLSPQAKTRVMKFLKKWALDKNEDVSAYACHTLALAGAPEKDRMLRLYDNREKLSALARARLARAFVADHDLKRAEALLKYAFEPQSIREASFHTLALLDLNPDDKRIPKLVSYLTSHRDKTRLSWGTTAENAHALLAIGEYYLHHPLQAKGEPHLRCSTSPDAADANGTALTNRARCVFQAKSVRVTNDGKVPAYLNWRRMELPKAEEVKDEAEGLTITRRYLRSDGSPADLKNLIRGEMLVTELTLTSDVTRKLGDLVIEDLFAGAFEPVQRELDPSDFKTAAAAPQVSNWILRKDARDDRMLIFSKAFKLEKGHEAKVYYPVRVVSAGDFILPGPSVEGMYNPTLHARRAPCRLVVRH